MIALYELHLQSAANPDRWVKFPGHYSEAAALNLGKLCPGRVRAVQVEHTDPAADRLAELAQMAEDVERARLTEEQREKARAGIRALRARWEGAGR